MGRFQVFETPLALARYKQASTDLLAQLDRVVTRRVLVLDLVTFREP